jgi:hypothetical protein
VLTVKEIGPQSRPTFDPETDELLDFQSQQMSAFLHGLMHRYNRGLDLVARESTEDDGESAQRNAADTQERSDSTT